MKFCRNITEMIGHTPLLRLEQLAEGMEIYAKCEFMNPLSLKDRPVLQIIQDAEESGQLKPGGTICGAGRYLKEKKPDVQLIAVEPRESPFILQGIFRPQRMMGTAPGFVPETLEREIIDEIHLVSEDEAFETCRRIARMEGLLVGISSGATAIAAMQIAKREENAGKMIVCILADTGQRYLSVEGLFE